MAGFFQAPFRCQKQLNYPPARGQFQPARIMGLEIQWLFTWQRRGLISILYQITQAGNISSDRKCDSIPLPPLWFLA
jgi:hypothetical protein